MAAIGRSTPEMATHWALNARNGSNWALNAQEISIWALNAQNKQCLGVQTPGRQGGAKFIFSTRISILISNFMLQCMIFTWTCQEPWFLKSLISKNPSFQIQSNSFQIFSENKSIFFTQKSFQLIHIFFKYPYYLFQNSELSFSKIYHIFSKLNSIFYLIFFNSIFLSYLFQSFENPPPTPL